MTRHRFGGDWLHRKVWAGDLLRQHAGIQQLRQRGHWGRHCYGTVTIEQIRLRLRNELRLPDGQFIELHKMVISIPHDPGVLSGGVATLEVADGVPVLTIPALIQGPPGPSHG